MGTSLSQFVSVDTGVRKALWLAHFYFLLMHPMLVILSNHQYADDTQLYISISPTAPTDAVILFNSVSLNYITGSALTALRLTLISPKHWFSTRQRSLSLQWVSFVNIAGSTIPIYLPRAKHLELFLTLTLHSINTFLLFVNPLTFTFALCAITSVLCLLRTSQLLLP